MRESEGRDQKRDREERREARDEQRDGGRHRKARTTMTMVDSGMQTVEGQVEEEGEKEAGMSQQDTAPRQDSMHIGEG